MTRICDHTKNHELKRRTKFVDSRVQSDSLWVNPKSSLIKVELSYKKEHTHGGETGNPAVKYLDDPNFITIAEKTALLVWIGKNQLMKFFIHG